MAEETANPISEHLPERLPNGKFAKGNTAAKGKNNREKRRAYYSLVYECLTEEGLCQIYRNLIGIASDFRHQAMAIKAADLLTKLAGLQVNSVELLDNGPDGETQEELRQRMTLRFREMYGEEAIRLDSNPYVGVISP
jgi:hypothetical protein